MSTTEKGAAFEEKVRGIIIELIEKDELGICGKFYKISPQKPMYSYLGKANIKFDLVIEFYRVENASPNFYVLVECKDYSSPVPASDLEEFYGKARQVLHANFKCMLFTTASLQERALNFATSTGMAVIRILDDDSKTWIVERTNKNLTTSVSNSIIINVSTALTNEYFVNGRHDTFGIFGFNAFTSVKEVLLEVVKSLDESSN